MVLCNVSVEMAERLCPREVMVEVCVVDEVCVGQETRFDDAFQWCGLGEAKHSSRGRSGLGKMTAQTVAGSRFPAASFRNYAATTVLH